MVPENWIAVLAIVALTGLLVAISRFNLGESRNQQQPGGGADEARVRFCRRP